MAGVVVARPVAVVESLPARLRCDESSRLLCVGSARLLCVGYLSSMVIRICLGSFVAARRLSVGKGTPECLRKEDDAHLGPSSYYPHSNQRQECYAAQVETLWPTPSPSQQRASLDVKGHIDGYDTARK